MKKLGWLFSLVTLPLLAETNHTSYYRANELSLAGFGYGVTRFDGRERYGLGVGVSYFMHRNWGAEIEAGSGTTRHVADYAGFSFIGRAPMGKFAPYAFAGMGRDLLDFDWTWHAGLGLEYRFTPNLAAFADVRGVSHLNSDSARGRTVVTRSETTQVWHNTMKTVTISSEERDLGDKFMVRAGVKWAF